MADFDPTTATPVSSGFDPETATPVTPTPSLLRAAGQAVENIPSSAGQFVKNLASTVAHPIDTAENLGTLAAGTIESGIQHGANIFGANMPEGVHQPQAEALGRALLNRYGSWDAFKNTLANDPVGMASDISALFGGGELALGRLAPEAGTAAKIASTVSKATNPVNAIAPAAKLVSRGVGMIAPEIIGNLGTHTGSIPLQLAAQAGREGGKAAQDFLDNLRGNAPMENVVQSARRAVSNMRVARSAAYRSGMADVGKDKSILDFTPIDDELNKVQGISSYKGQDISPETADVRQKLNSIVDNWKTLDPSDFHTPEGMDALKQKIGNVKNSLQFGTPERLAAERVYNSVRGAISDQAPQYSKVMGDYENASDALDEIQRSLSLGKRATTDTALRKLQSIMRNNVSSNYGARNAVAQKLEASGAPTLRTQIAGQSLNKWTPRGLGPLAADAALGAGAYMMNPHFLATLPLMSPRLMGEAAYYTGKAGGLGDYASSVARPVIQPLVSAAPSVALLGRMNEVNP